MSSAVGVVAVKVASDSGQKVKKIIFSLIG